VHWIDRIARGQDCAILVRKPFATVPSGSLVLRVATFPTVAAARAAETSASAVVEAVARAVHTHSGPEIFYLLTGEQCLETPAGVQYAKAGEGMVAPANTPMQLNVLGSARRDAFFVVVHDANEPATTPSAWQPSGRCARRSG
jgi:hypothetical protein